MAGAGSQSSTWDQLSEEIDRGRAFVAGAIKLSGAGNIPGIQLFNPAASNKIIQVVQMWCQNDDGQPCNVRTATSALTSIFSTGRNMLVGGAAGIGEIRIRDAATSVGTYLFSVQLPIQGALPVFERWGSQLSQSEGIHLECTTIGTQIRAHFVWIERDP